MNSSYSVHPSNFTFITEADVREIAKCDLKKLKTNWILANIDILLMFLDIGLSMCESAKSSKSGSLYDGKWIDTILR
ncbi:hypothetical protein L3Y34_019620 [Caenorhabditis briggsae]|uniref:Uncharacterized protein n=1 Tax=Caenorhabditis briggsae TaxID=6238 RepID=A0AAE9DQE6_CAEBR|nr:hypothetical protein L3Y34_019620 [Caenorhabditis briggsae]